MRQLVIQGIDDDLHREFKKTCVDLNIPMAAVIKLFLKSTVNTAGSIVKTIQDGKFDEEMIIVKTNDRK